MFQLPFNNKIAMNQLQRLVIAIVAPGVIRERDRLERELSIKRHDNALLVARAERLERSNAQLRRHRKGAWNA